MKRVEESISLHNGIDGINKLIESLEKIKNSIPKNANSINMYVDYEEGGSALYVYYYREYTLDEIEEQRQIRYRYYLDLKKEFEAQ